MLCCLYVVPQVSISSKQSQSVVSRDDEHKLDNDGTSSSIIYLLFQAQFRSVVKCPACHAETSNVEPFLFVSLPVPDATVSVSITIVRSHPHQSITKLSVDVSSSATVRDLRTAVARVSDIPAKQARYIIHNFVDLGYGGKLIC